MGKASKSKGARGELLWRDECHKAGFTSVQRGGQLPYQKGKALADAIGLAFVHQEVKNVERLNVRAAMEQSIGDCQMGEMPILAHHMNRKDWLVTMRAEDWFKIYRAWLDQQPPEKVDKYLLGENLQLFAKNLAIWGKIGYTSKQGPSPSNG